MAVTACFDQIGSDGFAGEYFLRAHRLCNRADCGNTAALLILHGLHLLCCQYMTKKGKCEKLLTMGESGCYNKKNSAEVKYGASICSGSEHTDCDP